MTHPEPIDLNQVETPVLCVGGPMDGQRLSIPILSDEWQQRQFFAVDQDFETVTYWIHALRDKDGKLLWIATLAERRDPIAQMVDGYRAAMMLDANAN